MKHLLKMSDLSPAELHHILDVAEELKAEQKAGTTPALLKGRSVALMFSKNSTRTRTSFEVGVYQLGGLGNYMNAATELQSGRGEPLKDTARVLGRYYDCVVWRTYRQCDLEEFAELAGVPVINGLTDYAHPCQVLADLMTIRERRGTLEGQKLCFIGDGCSMANSLIVGGLLAGMRVTCVCPEGYRPAADVLMFAHKYGEKFHLLTDPAEGVKDADVVVTAAWNTAPGTPESERRLRDFAGFQVTSRLMEGAKPDAMLLHCLPAHRGEEISTAVFEEHADEIFDEAENRLHVQKAVLAILLAGLYAEGQTTVIEPAPSRDHTERMFRALGVEIETNGNVITLEPPEDLHAVDIAVPADISSAAFFLVAGAIVPGSELTIKNVGVNPTRTGIIDVLRSMGADITESNFRDDAEPVCDLTVRHSRLHGTEIGGAIIPRLIDELPVIAVAAAFAEGETVIRDAQELKVKESNRIAAMVAELTKAGVDVEETDDGMIVRGGAQPHGAAFETYKDHRIAMSLAVLGLAAEGASRIDEPEVVAISYPDFFATLEKLGG